MYIFPTPTPSGTWRKYFFPYRITLKQANAPILYWRPSDTTPLTGSLPLDIDVFAVNEKLGRLGKLIKDNPDLRIAQVHIDARASDLLEISLTTGWGNQEQYQLWNRVDRLISETFCLALGQRHYD